MIPFGSLHVFYGRLAAAFVALLLGTFPILAGLGLMATDTPVEPLAVPFVLLFGAAFVSLGVAAVWSPLRRLAEAAGSTNGREARALAWRRLRARVNGSSAGAAAGVGALAGAFWLSLAGVQMPLVGDAETLGHVVSLEFLTIHAFPFLVVAVTFFRSGSPGVRAFAMIWAGVLALVYGVLAWLAAGGLAGLGWLIYLALPNVMPFARTAHTGAGPSTIDNARVMAVSRWCVKFALFLIVAAVTGDGELSSSGGVLLGSVYFSLLAGIELFRIVELPVDLAAEWSRMEEASV